MSVMNETAIGLSDLLTQGNRMIAAWREALNDLEALLCLIERASGQRGRQEPVEDDSVIPSEMKEEEAPAETPNPKRSATLEEARKLLSRKSRDGYRAEVKALLTKHGYAKLTEISDPLVFGALVEEAEGLGCQSTPI